MAGVLWVKIIEEVECHTLKELLIFLSLIFFAGILSATATNVDFALWIRDWNHGAIPTIFWINVVVFSAPTLWRMFKNTTRKVTDWSAVEEETEKESGLTIEGIPIGELLDHLFKARSFKRDDVEERWKIPRYKYTALSKKLKDLGVLIKGKVNNTTVLKEGITREEVARILKTGDSVDDLEKSINIVRPLPSSPNFIKRRLGRETLKETHVQPMRNPCATACAAA